jgi:uncharacterized metal-binding protein YceD (DUF177 family)
MLIQGKPEFSRPFIVDRLGATPLDETISATREERDRLGKRLGLAAIDQLAAVITLRRSDAAGIIHVSGRLEADVAQTCIVTLAAFPCHVEDSFDVDFGTEPADPGAEIVLDLENEPPEPIIDGVIDLGELVTQYLSLALDPYPRAPGVSFEPVMVAEDESLSPFAVLRNLKAAN